VIWALTYPTFNATQAGNSKLSLV